MATTTKPTAKGSSVSGLQKDVLETLSLLESFNALLTEETTALKKQDFKKVDTLQVGKKALAQQYHAMVLNLASHKDEMAGLDIQLRERLVRTRTVFTETLNSNMRTLEAVKDSSQRLTEKILEAARRSVVDNNQTHYSAKAQPQACKTSSMSLSVDKQF